MTTLFGIYIHWPFCMAKCPYCDFNSHVAATIDHGAWKDAYLKEIEYYPALTPGRRVTSIFFGGGTPSLMEPSVTAAAIDAVARHWDVAADVEITLEANPTSVERDKFAGFRAAGVNRVSLGVQALNDRDLKFLGRQHDAAEAMAALEIANKTFDRVSFDLIYARPDQTLQGWRQELAEALDRSSRHLSLYQLTIEEGTPFYMRHGRGDFKIPEEGLAADLYEATQEMMEDAGLPAYEVSNHAREGEESRHNLAYWRYADYVGIGPGAHGRLTIDGVKHATRGHRAPQIWLDRVARDGQGGHPMEAVSEQQRFTEALMMGLRLREGVVLAGVDQAKVATLVKEGLLTANGDRIAPTKAGMQRLNGVLQFLV